MIVKRLVLLLALGQLDHSVRAFWSSPSSAARGRSNRAYSLARKVSASAGADFSASPDSNSLQQQLIEQGIAFLNEEDLDQKEIEQRKQRMLERKLQGQFFLSLPFDAANPDLSMSLVQVFPGRQLGTQQLNVQTMELEPLLEEETKKNPEISQALSQLDPTFEGVMAYSVGASAYAQGARPGSILAAVSATMGDIMWPKSTLEGVKAALSSRSVVAGAVQFALLHQTAPRQEFELTLKRPLGFDIQQQEDAVVVTRIHENASNLVRYGVQVGDRVVAVDASLGDQLWPVSTVEGVTSACTSRLPGQPVTLRFERPVVTDDSQQREEQPNYQTASEVSATAPVVSDAPTQTSSGMTRTDQQKLVERCREVLKRYSSESPRVSRSQRDGKASVRSKLDSLPALVADKVVDALASASVTMDAVTLALIMRAYLSCQQPDAAIQLFEASVGYAGDASLTPVKAIVTGKEPSSGILVPAEAALNLITGTILMQAQSMKGDLAAVQRIVAALEGQSGKVIDGEEVAPWPWTGTFGTIKPDTRLYNVALAAAERWGDIDFAFEIFRTMKEPTKTGEEDVPKKNSISYNTMISALGSVGRTSDAFALFEKMKRVGLRPDKFTYTALIKSCKHEGDMQELLYDMAESGIQADVILYNTVVRLLAGKRQWSAATKLITEMESRGISPDSMTYGFLMNAMLKADKPSACLALFESACANERTSALMHNAHLYTIAITAASMLRNHERALELVARMTANGVRPTLKTLTSVVGACIASGSYDLAMEVFRKIDKPDGYAISQGIQAACGSGELESAFTLIENQRRPGRAMSGKQMMTSYQRLVFASLKRKDYEMARRALNDLLKKGFIPNKALLRSIVEAFDIKISSVVEASSDDLARFRFLLFVVDSIRRRNLPIESNLYVSTLVLGRQIGGVQRRVADLLSKARAGETESAVLLNSSDTPQSETEEPVLLSWEGLLDESDGRRKELEMETAALPALNVRVGNREMGRVLRAEKAVAFHQKRRPKATTS